MEHFLDRELSARWFGDRPRRIAVRATRVRGGLQADAVHVVTASGRDAQGRRIERRYVRKVAHGTPAREAGVYQRLVQRHLPGFAPDLLHVGCPAEGTAILCLEHVDPVQRWPWAQLEVSAAVLERLARLHEVKPAAPLPAWDYDAELAVTAAWTLDVARRVASSPARELVQGALKAIEDVVTDLGPLRRHLGRARPFAGRVLHGDLHPGNVLCRDRGGRLEVLLVDWARARIGSALEDVSAWLQSLAVWEPEMHRRHDTLLARYLAAAGAAPRLTTELRDLYWLATASNALAGALAVHLTTVAAQPAYDPAAPAARCARGWIRALRQGRARLRSRA
jgi:hypothetical protein